jgi:hypothetical protein
MTELEPLPQIEEDALPVQDQTQEQPPKDDAELPAQEESTPPEFDATPAEPQGEQEATASIFANPNDLYRYQKAIANGASHREALKVGDNGQGKWGDNTATYKIPMVALPADTPGLEHNRLVKVTGPNGSVIAKIGDVMPETDKLEGKANIDLNPAAALAVGHTGGLAPVKWSWVTDEGSANQTPVLSGLPKEMSAKQSFGSLGSDSIVPPIEGDSKITSQNKDGSVTWSDGVTIYPDGTMYRDIAGERIIRHPNGATEKRQLSQSKGEVKSDSQGRLFDINTGKEVTPPGFALKPKVFKDTNTGLAFDISDVNNPKPINLPGNPAAADLSQIKQGDWNSVPEDVRDVAKNIAEYRYPKISGFALRSPYFQQMFKVISKVDPSFDYKNYDARQHFLTNFSGSGKIGQNILSFDTALDHMGRALGSSDVMESQEKKSDVPANKLGTGVYWNSKNLAGDPRKSAYDADADTLAGEYIRAITGAAPDVADKKQWADRLTGGWVTVPNATQRKAVMNEMAHNLGSRLGEIEQQYKRTMGKDLDVSLLSPEAEATLSRVGATDIIQKYGSHGGKRPYADPANGFSPTDFPGSDKAVSPGEREILEDENGKKFISSPDGKLIPYGQ